MSAAKTTPLYTLTPELSHLPHLMAFVLLAVFFATMSASRRRAEFLLKRARNEMEDRVIERTAVEAFRRKASGYLLKDSAASELTTAIREALLGRTYVSMLDHASGSQGNDSRELSSREREVLQLLAEGKSMKEVAAVLEISPRTVEFHKYRMMELLGVRTNAELVQYAIRHGLIAP